MGIQTKKMSEWLAENGQAITNASEKSMKTYLEQNLRPLQDGVYIGKIQKELTWSYMRCEAWQTTNIGISKADADVVVVQHGSLRIGIALTEPGGMKWGSVENNTSIGYQTSRDWSLLDGKARTEAIMASSFYKNDDPNTYAVAYCYNYSKSHAGDPGGEASIPAKSWYLPSTGELEIIRSHFETINLALQRIKNAGKQKADLLKRSNYWSSVEISGTNGLYLNFKTGYRDNISKVNSSTLVRPVTAF